MYPEMQICLTGQKIIHTGVKKEYQLVYLLLTF
jgi:hypothetical protein